MADQQPNGGDNGADDPRQELVDRLIRHALHIRFECIQIQNFLLKLAKDKPSWTIQAQPGPATGPFHWENRRLSQEELCRLQTFPDGLRFNCNHAEIQKMVGNAVPSALAESLAREIAAQFFGINGALDTSTLAPSAQESFPPPERRLPVPKKFLHLAHSDSAHPGTGLGRGAAYREREAA